MSANLGAIDYHGAVPRPRETAESSGGPGDNYLTHGKGIVSWLFTLDHKRIGLMYMIGVLSAFFARRDLRDPARARCSGTPSTPTR